MSNRSPNLSVLDTFFDRGIDINSKTLYLGSGSAEEDVDSNLAERVIKGLITLDELRPESPITLIINCGGGDTTHGMAIFDSIRGCNSTVVGKVIGSAESMAAWILQACDVRLMTANSKLMIHRGSVSLEGHIEDVIKQARALELSERKFDDILLERIRVKRPKYSRRALRDRIRFDWKLEAEEAYEWGLIDAVV